MNLRFHRVATTILLLFAGSALILSSPSAQPMLTAVKQGNRLEIKALVPGLNTVEVRLLSSRNDSISCIKDISPDNPDPSRVKASHEKSDRNFWYPVVDVALEPGMEALLLWDIAAPAECLIAAPWYKNRQPVQSEIIVPAQRLEHWENSVLVQPDKARLTGFQLRRTLPVAANAVQHTFRLLSHSWAGTVVLADPSTGRELARTQVHEGRLPLPPQVRGAGLSRKRVLDALSANVDFVLRSQNMDPDSPMAGGIYLFYDRAARTYRTPHWMWGWGPTIRMLLDAAEVDGIAGGDRLVQAAQEITDCTMRARWNAPGELWDGASVSRWARGGDNGYQAAVTMGDGLFLAGWAWVPMYRKTGDRRYLEAALRQVDIAEELMKSWDLIPHSYFPETGEWMDIGLDETGFGMEGFAELYLATGERHVLNVGKQYLDQHLKIFQREDGRWDRLYRWKEKTVQPHSAMTRGCAWTVEALIGGYRMTGDQIHLDNARKMAQFLLEYQRPDASWAFQYDQDVALVGISEKGTAAWSYFFYKLHSLTGEVSYLRAARKALAWCIDHQYFGADPDGWGGIYGQTHASGVGYRQFFPLACTYTAGFFGLALMEELQLNDE